MCIIPKLGGGFKYCLFSSLFGEDSHFDSYFSDGLVQPPTRKSRIPKSLDSEIDFILSLIGLAVGLLGALPSKNQRKETHRI